MATFSEPAGSYMFAVEATPSWKLVSLTCDAVETISVANRTVTINLGNAENVSCTFTESQRRPDESIATDPDGPFAGEAVYASGVLPEQTVSQVVGAGQRRSFYVRATNSSLDADRFRLVTALHGSTLYSVSFFVAGQDVTRKVKRGLYTFTLVAGATRTIEIRVQALAGVGGQTTRDVDLTMKSRTATLARDLVRAHVSTA